ncbi:hypothetical protein ACWIUD_01905 [Helicobacter sp. 23-1044]
MAVAVSRSTQILIENFVSTYFSSVSNDNRAKIRDSVVEIADSILEQNNKDLDKLATKGDIAMLKDEITLVRSETKDEIALVRSETKDEIKKLELKIIESKYDLLKWLVTAQLAIAGLLLAMIKLI